MAFAPNASNQEGKSSVDQEYTFTKFDQASEKYPDNTAVVFLGRKFSYSRLNRMVNSFANGLTGMGVGKGDRVVIYLSNCIQFVIAFLAVQKIGAVTVLVSPIYTSREIEYMINDAGAETIICHDTNYGYVQNIFDGTTLKRIIVTNLLDLLSWPQRTMAALFDKNPHGKAKGGAETKKFKDLLKSSSKPPSAPIDPVKDISYILYTGGTTGFPKGVPGNHAGHTSYVNDIMRDVFKDHALEGKDVYIAVNPLFHIMALGLFMAIGLNMGNMTVLMPVPQVDAILNAIGRYKVRWFLGVPMLYRMALENDRLEQYDLSSLRYCYCGGDVLPREVLNRWKEKFGIPIYQVYGSTEAGHITYSRIDEGGPQPMCIGAPWLPVAAWWWTRKRSTPMPQGESGELLVTSRYTLKEYLNKPDETAASYVKLNGDVYYRTGDFVYKGPDDQLYYVERSADILKHKGYRVSASEVEAVLQDHGCVIGACVVGVPDKKVGERIKAIVVLKEDAKGVGASELTHWCRERLASYKVPSYIEFRDMLPKSKVGKLLRREIRDEERRKQEKEKVV